MEFKKIGCLNEEKAATSITNFDIELTEEEIEFELEEKTNLINRLFERYDVDEDTLPAHLF